MREQNAENSKSAKKHKRGNLALVCGDERAIEESIATGRQTFWMKSRN
jgi:phosphoribosyl-AMP cyclohydrolase